MVALFAAGLATFELLYSTQAILPELATRFDVSSTETTLTLSLATLSLGRRDCWSSDRCPTSSAGPG